VRACVDEADGSPGHGVLEPTDMLNELEMLVTMSIMSEDPNSGEIPRVRLGGTRWHAGDTNRPGNQTDVEGPGGRVERPDGLRTCQTALKQME